MSEDDTVSLGDLAAGIAARIATKRSDQIVDRTRREAAKPRRSEVTAPSLPISHIAIPADEVASARVR